MQTTKHIWKFSKIGGVFRVNIESGKDLLALDQLDQKLWTALSCPANGLEIDATTLKLIDTDNDGRIRVPEILAATKWITSLLKNPDDLLQQSNTLPLTAINDTTEIGKSLLASAQQILSFLGKASSTTISTDDTQDSTKIFANTQFNGDGIITKQSTESLPLQGLIEDIIKTQGSQIDRCGLDGINAELIEAFYADCQAFDEWKTKAEKCLPWGEKSETIYQNYSKIQAKVEDYFLRCRLAEFDPQTTDILNLLNARIESISTKDLSECLDEIATYPIAKIEVQRPLPLHKGINPAWEAILHTFKTIVPELLDKNTINETEWKQISAKIKTYQTYISEKAGDKVEFLGLAKIKEYLAENKKDSLLELVASDQSKTTESANIILVDQLLRYHRDLFRLLRNYVSFHDLYAPKELAIFQAGKLYIDQRSCDLCIEVSDMPKHGTMAGLSNIYLLYCHCVSKSTGKQMTVVAALTNGEQYGMIVGKNAIFYDRKGIDYDATIVKIIENPISIPQAFWAPYRKLSKFIGDQMEKMASDKDAEMQTQMKGKVEKSSTIVEKPVEVKDKDPKKPQESYDMGKYLGIFAAIGLALGALGTAVAALVSGFMGLIWWQMPLAMVGLLLVISGPSMFLAWLKLRKRNLAPVLDANGWAINSKVKINTVFGKTLTQISKLPKNAIRDLRDPFVKKRNPLWYVFWILITVAIIFLTLWYFKLLPSCLSCCKM